MAESTPTGEFCQWCGRELVDVYEPSPLFDRETGTKTVVTYRQCPRYPSNAWQAMWRGCHMSYDLAHPLMNRSWE